MNTGWQWLEETLGTNVVRVEPAWRHTIPHPNVCRVETSDGRRLAVKRVRNRSPQTRGGHDALTTEWEILRLLQEMARCVPTPVTFNVEEGILVTTWVEGETLDDLAQHNPQQASSHVTEALTALEDIERTFDINLMDVEPFAFQLDYDAYLSSDFAEFVKDAVAAFDWLLARANQSTSQESAELRKAWDALYDTLCEGAPTFGTLDYNARNLILSDSRPTYVDFSAVGWDWPERRIVQYFIALGAHHPEGNFVQTLTRRAVERLGEHLFFSPERLEAHRMVFLGVALERLLRNGEPREGNRRFETLLRLLLEEALTDFAPAEFLQERLRESLRGAHRNPKNL